MKSRMDLGKTSAAAYQAMLSIAGIALRSLLEWFLAVMNRKL